MKIKPILLVAGEPNSVFLEIFFKSIKNIKIRSPLVLICCKNDLKKQLSRFKVKKNLRILKSKKINDYSLNNRMINIIDVPLKKSPNKKQNNLFITEYIKLSFELGIKLLKSRYTYKFINGPINKKSFLNKKFLGITEYIANNFKEKKIGMLIYNKNLSVSPLTTHLPIRLVSKDITKKKVKEKIQLIHNFYKNNLKINPKIAVTGLNPHCESILNFNEDEKIIKPAIIDAKRKKINVNGPFAADTIFLKKNREKYDVILGMFHDQVLGPLKALYEYDAINITMGLPILRVSPDHGPNAKMVGKNKSNPQSLIKALQFLDNK